MDLVRPKWQEALSSPAQGGGTEAERSIAPEGGEGEKEECQTNSHQHVLTDLFLDDGKGHST